MTTARRRAGPARVAAVALVTLVAVMALAGRAHAATAYRYWAYYVAHANSWQFSQRGPAAEYPVDGEVQGWRFAIQAEAGRGLAPRALPDFAKLCGATPVTSGQLRVGIVIDFGVSADAPAGERPPGTAVSGCVHVADGGSGADVLRAAAAVRSGTGSDGGLVCGIDGYPANECAAVVAAKPAPTPTPTATGKAMPTATPLLTAPAKGTAPVPAAASSTEVPAARSSTAKPSTATSSPPPTPAASAPSNAISSSPPTLASLRTAATRPDHFPVGAVVGAALVVAIGAGASWRARAGRR
ncbi:MAG: hypothetical protein QOC73_22 [Actinomycetota bacterium]|nr:hypothetical protein [Actinomycetota bacterium]